jgi:hypothetical protein
MARAPARATRSRSILEEMEPLHNTPLALPRLWRLRLGYDDSDLFVHHLLLSSLKIFSSYTVYWVGTGAAWKWCGSSTLTICSAYKKGSGPGHNECYKIQYCIRCTFQIQENKELSIAKMYVFIIKHTFFYIATFFLLLFRRRVDIKKKFAARHSKYYLGFAIEEDKVYI